MGNCAASSPTIPTVTIDPELYSRLGSIEAKVDILLASRTTDSKRLGKLERFEARVAGISAAMSLAVALIVKTLF